MSKINNSLSPAVTTLPKSSIVGVGWLVVLNTNSVPSDMLPEERIVTELLSEV